MIPSTLTNSNSNRGYADRQKIADEKHRTYFATAFQRFKRRAGTRILLLGHSLDWELAGKHQVIPVLKSDIQFTPVRRFNRLFFPLLLRAVEIGVPRFLVRQ